MNEFDLLVFTGDDELLNNYDNPALADVTVVDAESIDITDAPLPEGFDEDVPF